MSKYIYHVKKRRKYINYEPYYEWEYIITYIITLEPIIINYRNNNMTLWVYDYLFIRGDLKEYASNKFKLNKKVRKYIYS